MNIEKIFPVMFFGALIVTILCILFFLVGSITGVNSHYSDGTRSGQVIKLSCKGIFCKTQEGYLMMGGTKTDANGNLVSNQWEFNVPMDKPELYKIIQDAETSGNRVTIVYRQWMISPWYNTSDYEVVSVTQDKPKVVAPVEAEEKPEN